MKNLYIEDPIKIMDKIESLDEMYKNKNKDEEKEKDKHKNTNDLDFHKNSLKEEENKPPESPQKLTLNNTSFKPAFKDDFKGALNEADKKKDLIEKDEFQS